MKAIQFKEYGTPDCLYLNDVEKPTPNDHEILIKLHASSINSWDLELLNGIPFANRVMFGLFKPKKVNTLGIDVAGVIEAVGKEVTKFQAGDEVFGDLSGYKWGGFAEYTCARESDLMHKPSNLSFEEAAAVPQAALLALQALHYKGSITKGQKVLINGASGGVGTFAIQLAKFYGAEVTGVCSSTKMDLVRSLGADHVIDYTKEDFSKKGELYDLIVDIKGFHSIFAYHRALNKGGKYAMVGGSTSLVNQVLFLGPLISLISDKKMGLMLHKANKGLDTIKKLLEEGKVKPVIDRRYPLHEVPDAMHYYAKGFAKGKVVINIL